MNFLLIVVLGFAVVYLWRRYDALQVQMSYLDQTLEEMRYHLARQLERNNPARDKTAISPVAEQDEADAASPTEPVADPVEDVVEPARAGPAIIAASRIEGVVASRPEPEPPAEPDASHEPGRPRFKFDFEDFFGRLLPIWAGGIALAVAGFFLVRYSIEKGLLGPEVRVALGFLFGGGLLGAAEIAYRQEHRIADPRVRQALAGAGLATLYASFYLAGTLYGLIGSSIAFLGMAGVTGSAILLSFRFGLPSAILGLVGGFAAPMMVTSQETNVPVLALYLALVTGGLTYAGNKQGRSWLALAALASGLGWGVLILVSGVTGVASIMAFGGYIVVLGAIVPAFIRSGDDTGFSGMTIVRMGAAALAAIQMAAMVEQSGFSMLAWGLYGLLAAAFAFFAWNEPRLREANAFAAGLGLFMLGQWWDASLLHYSIVAAALAAIFAGVPLANIWRDAHRKIDTLQIGGFALGLMIVTGSQLSRELSDPMLALVTALIAALPALASWRLWPTFKDKVAKDTLLALTVTAIGMLAAGLLVTPSWAAPLVLAAVALGLIALGWKREDNGLAVLAWTASFLTVFTLTLGDNFNLELAMLGMTEPAGLDMRGILRWIVTSLPFAALALRSPRSMMTHVAEVATAALFYGVIAHIMPSSVLAWIVAGLAVLVAFADKERLAARLTFALIIFAWMLEPLAAWLIGAGGALAGEPMLIAGELGWREMSLRMVPMFVAVASLTIRPAEILKNQVAGIAGIAGAIAAVIGHSVFKQFFALETAEQFAVLGLAERTVWQAVLLIGGIAVIKFAADKSWAKPVGITLFAAALAHFAVFTFALHNPLWSEQAVGSWPIANLLLPAYGIAIAAAVMLRRLAQALPQLPMWVFDAVIMMLIAALALSELRHLFSGSLLTDDMVGQTEDLLRSVIGIVLAIGFLLWGARSQSRSWRIGSLVLMLGAVLKVFLLDASGLDGLVRVASFVALGFSLIGIGWFYTRQLAGVTKRPD